MFSQTKFGPNRECETCVAEYAVGVLPRLRGQEPMWSKYDAGRAHVFRHDTRHDICRTKIQL
jgi:hypothetical protein